MSFLGRFNKEEDKKIDVYAYGISFYEILSGEDAWPGLTFQEIRSRVLNGFRPKITNKLLDTFKDHVNLIELMSKCWDQNPILRPNFDYICDLFQYEGQATITVADATINVEFK